MKDKKQARTAKARQAIDDFFEFGDLPRPRFEMFDRVNRDAARAALLERLAGHPLDPGDAETYETLFSFFDLRDEVSALAALASDTARTLGIRSAALWVLERLAPAAVATVTLDSEDRNAIERLRLRDLVVLEMEADDAPVAETLALGGCTDELFAALEKERHALGASAALLYGRPLFTESVRPLHDPMVDAVAAEPSLGSLSLLQTIGTEHRDATLRERCSAEAAAMRDRLAASPGELQGERGALLIPDEDGRQATLAFWIRPSSGNVIYVEAVIAGGVLRFVAVAPRLPDSTLSEVREHPLGAHLTFEQAATYFLTEVESDPAEPLDRAAVAVAERITAFAELPAVEPAAAVTGVDVDILLELFDGSWDLLPELSQLGVPELEMTEIYLQELARRTDVVDTLRWMCGIMVLWHQLTGQSREASLMARIALDVKERFAQSIFVRALLDRTILLAEQDEDRGQPDEFEEEFGEVSDGDDEDDDSAAASRRRIRAEMLRVVARQIRGNDPPQVGETFERLQALDVPPAEAKRRIAAILAEEILEVVQSNREFDNARYVERIEALAPKH